ncbi:hypothetical protein VQH23_16390 [Pararoseomonas sp. SCSIO 73927]|uniref:hypothetical protein n=1 Tax=Pararoseomonas sp. SCSIO 73927 TaxID=3114537 RepID=UPI0030CE55ED
MVAKVVTEEADQSIEVAVGAHTGTAEQADGDVAPAPARQQVGGVLHTISFVAPGHNHYVLDAAAGPDACAEVCLLHCPIWPEGDGYTNPKRDDFATLAEILRRLKGRFLLSLNDHPEVRRIFEGFAMEEVPGTYVVGSRQGGGAARGELLISDR